VECCRIKIRAVRPRQNASFVIETHGVEHDRIPQWPEEDTVQYRPEVDLLRGPIREGNRQGVRTDDVEPRDAMNGMGHGLPEWFDLDRRLARLQEIPISLQFLSMDLCPGFHESPLRSGKAAAEALNRVEGKGRGVILVIRVKMRAMMGLALLSEHPNDDPEEPR
jgi:hypothetical protein